jgi:hypothetical protein
MRIILIIVISKESQKKGLGEGRFNILELRSNPFWDSLDKLLFLFQ